MNVFSQNMNMILSTSYELECVSFEVVFSWINFNKNGCIMMFSINVFLFIESLLLISCFRYLAFSSMVSYGELGCVL